jgi:signal transduction histidine kinase
MVARMAVVAFALILGIVAIRVVGQRLSTARYHAAAITQVARIEPALLLRVEVTNAQAAVQGYVLTGETRYLDDFARATGQYLTSFGVVERQNRALPDVTAAVTRLGALANDWLFVARQVVDLANAGQTRAATLLARGRLTPFIHQHQLLLQVLRRRRLNAIDEADRWAALSYWLSNAAIGLGGVLVVLFSALLTQRVLKPLATLRAATARIATGLPGEPVPLPRHNDEIRELAESVNAMEHDLAVARHQLEARAADLERANRLKTELVANVSHELRTPLSAIIGYAQLLLDATYASLQDSERADMEIILTSAQHLLLVINDLLDMSRIESGRLELTKQVTDLRRIIQQVCDESQPGARAKGLRLEFHVPNAALTAVCDPVRVRQILVNLVGNAVKFTSSGSVRVRALERADVCEIAVEDTGPGIPQEDIPRIWEQFHQVDGSLTRRAGGTGLGLAITRELVLQHEGTITCDSVVGVGSTFTVRLPGSRADQRELPASKVYPGSR